MDNDWKLYVGIVAEDKEYNSKELKVYVQEILPFMTNIGDYTEQQNVKLTDILQDKELEKTVKNTNIIITEYFDLFTNRQGPPDMRKGEQVFIMRYADTDKYYWYPMGRDDNLRRLERFRLAVSDNKEIQKELNDDNTYFIEMDTLHGKHILLSTSKSDGEKYRYFIRVDSITNSVKIFDDSGNEIILESDVPRIRAKNRDGTFIDLFKKDFIGAAPRDMVLKADRQMLINAESLKFVVDKAIVALAQEYGIEVENLSLNGGTIGLNGAVKLIGSLLSSPITAASYSQGGPGDSYPKPSIDLSAGKSTTPGPEADPGPDTSGNRHSAAKEQMLQCMEIIERALVKLQPIGGLDDEINQLTELAEASKMALNKGK